MSNQATEPGGTPHLLTETASGLLCRFEGHLSWVLCVAFSADGRFALSGSGQPSTGLADVDYSLRLWDVDAALQACLANSPGPLPAPTIRPLRSFVGHSDRVTAVTFLADGRLALSGSHDATVRLWEVATGRELRYLSGHNDRIRCLAAETSGRYALSGGCDETIRLWNLQRGVQELCFRNHRQWVTSLALTQDGRYALSGSADGMIRLWYVPADRQDRAAGPPWLRQFLGRIRSGEQRHFAGHQQTVTGLAFAPTGAVAVSASMDRLLRLWDVHTGEQIREFAGHRLGVTSVAFASDGRRLLSGSLDGTVRLWDAETGREIRCFEGHQDVVTSVALSPDGRLALSGSADRIVSLWRLPG